MPIRVGAFAASSMLLVKREVGLILFWRAIWGVACHRTRAGLDFGKAS